MAAISAIDSFLIQSARAPTGADIDGSVSGPMIISVGAPTYVAVEAADKLAGEGTPADVYCVNGFPVADDFFDGVAAKYDGVVTVEEVEPLDDDVHAEAVHRDRVPDACVEVVQRGLVGESDR